jgi:hypothetical protein
MRAGHRNEKGELVSLSAWRRWYVIRDKKFVPLLELKDPTLARTRSRKTELGAKRLGRFSRGAKLPGLAWNSPTEYNAPTGCCDGYIISMMDFAAPKLAL